MEKVKYSEDGKTLLRCPESYKGKFVISDGVTEIGSHAFYNCSGLTSIVIPSSVTAIEHGAFALCAGLTSVVIPNSVTEIGGFAFFCCRGLTSIEIPDSVGLISKSALIYTGPQLSITVDEKSKCFCSVDGSLYSKDMSVLYHWCDNGSKVFTIPKSVAEIGDSVFEDCSGLISIVIPNGVTEIGKAAFEGCKGLTSIEIPDSVTSIGYSAFFGCSGLTSIVIPKGVTAIGSETFRKCTGLTTIKIPNSVTTIGEMAFLGCTGLTSLNIPDSVKLIEWSALSNTGPQLSITVDEENKNFCSVDGTLYSKDMSVLYHWCGIKSNVFTIPDSVREIERHAFEGKLLKELHIRCKNPDVIDVNDEAFDEECTENCVLYVPIRTRITYREHFVFRYFKKVMVDHNLRHSKNPKGTDKV